MRISLNWLRELVDIQMTPQELAETLTVAGFEVEDIEDWRSWADGVVLGKILQAEQHPNADKLRVCQVDISASEPLNIVCGAPNAAAGMVVAVATLGTYLPKIDLTLKKTKLRGVPSEGMICSLAELGLEKDSSGIHSFDLENPILGSDVRPLLGLDDVILDVTATANRADGLSMVGIAREIAALTGASLRIPEAAGVLIEQSEQSQSLSIKIADKQACPIYIGTIIEGVKIAPSPDWLQRRLQAAGVRPINNVVDVTNYILLEWGQPLHAFDLDRLKQVTSSPDLTIGVRFAKLDESIKTLDGQTRKLQEQNLLITANDYPVALAGVMGGEETEVFEGTQNLLLEAAIFAPIAIRRSARSQGLRSESSTRYERGVNQAELALACRRAIVLLKELASGTSTRQETDSSGIELQIPEISLRLDRINQVLGQLKRGQGTAAEFYLLPEKVEGILTALGCGLVRDPNSDSVAWKVTVPPYRYRDLEREIDLIEEVARLYGYDNFCETLPSQGVCGYLPLEQLAMRQIRATFRGQGLTELMHYSLVKTEGKNQVVLDNPLFVEYSALRTEMLTGLIDAFVYNLQNGNGPLNGFEIGRIFWKEGDKYKEQDALAGIMGGDRSFGRWVRSAQEQPMTWFEAKGILEAVFQRLNLTVEYKPESTIEQLHPGRTASLWLQGKRLGIFGQLHPQLCQKQDLPNQVYAFEFQLSILLEAMNRPSNLVRKFKPFSTFPASDRDIAFFVPVEVPVSDLERCITKAAGNLLESVEVFDEYRGKNVPEGQRSLAFRLVYRVSDRTLTDTDIDPVQQKVRDALVQQFNVNLRS
ncbi:Phenylalanine--tRNA ligase beta subunit [Planktothrix tepida]|uniref:Phenylalanine--tRNA ligase beta subunit n=1 Tax=Planktothrix tepida PCC 9214 TaxID=671072 RepID=A0A1J1LEG1_9CYAN|nr:phenylalanine--tRNA ligase subunit beta [Planktothrix tepida]CAD5921241.1 Phenylalanine--tRNA ligase beta subunit [Planktothrix tepida]CUR30963.1 Phenylalanine--tRNA ligase beta subunit [Planktothrix tepida PCC 9214]